MDYLAYRNNCSANGRLTDQHSGILTSVTVSSLGVISGLSRGMSFLFDIALAAQHQRRATIRLVLNVTLLVVNTNRYFCGGLHAWGMETG